ncbi:MAG: serine hydrolase domain-containing protein [Phycisphaerales bacterium JB054]
MIAKRSMIGCWVCGLLAAYPPSTVAQPGPPGEAVRELLSQYESPGAPGVAVAVVRDGQTVLVESVGLAHLEHDVPIDGNTVFHTASVSKQFTAAAVLLLEREGKLSLDDDVREYLPELPDLGHTIRLRHLLWHTSGLRDQWQLLGAAGWREDDAVTNEHVWRAIVRQRALNFEPGTQEMYCNTGYTLLAEIVSRLSGEPFSAFCDREIFGPLGMDATRFHDDVHAVVPRRAESYFRAEDDTWRRYGLSFGTVGATGLLTTAEDLARWAAELLTGRVLGQDLIARMVEPGQLETGEKISYASGLFVGESRGLRSFWHPGGDSGFRAGIQCYPERGIGVVVLANRADINAWAMPYTIAKQYLEADAAPEDGEDGEDGENGEDAQAEPRTDGQGSPGRTGTKPTPITQRAAFAQPEPSGTADPDAKTSAATRPLDDVAGRYRSAELETVYELRAQDDGILAVHFRNEPVELRPLRDGFYGGGSWYFREIEIVRAADGSVEGFLLHNSRARNLWFARE